MHRRNFMNRAAMGTAAGAATLAAATGVRADSRRRNRPTFVFVHGAWHGGWCWSEVVRLLAERGYPAIALDLPGHGITARLPQAYLQQPQNPAALATEVSPLMALTLDDYRDHTMKMLRGLVEDSDDRVILVGHSLGGATLSAVGEAAPELVKRLVYLTAFVPVTFNNVLAYLQQPNFASSQVPPLFVADPALVGCARINHDSADAAYVAADKGAFYGDVAPSAFQAVANLLTPDEPIQAFTTPVVVTPQRWGRLPRTFIRCTEDRAIPLIVQDQMIQDADGFTPRNRFQQETLHTSHSAFAAAPQALTDLLIRLA
jgi:pimeloyl-ACP methyl ester carboxylesterase